MSSGFNLLSLKKVENNDVKTIYRPHVVVGDDLFSVALYLELKKAFGAEQVGWVCPRPVTKRDLLPLGPNTLRGEANIENFKRVFPDIETREIEAPSEFFKELKWRKFGGRAKSEKLLWNEEFFTYKRADFDIFALFPFLKEEDLYVELEKNRMDVGVKGILKTVPEDLAEPANFQIELSNNDILKCAHLYWGGGPQSFLDTYENKNQLTNEFITFCEEATAPSALYVQIEFKKKVTAKKQTLFIPLSYTHEWGHFVGEFKELENEGQRGEFVTFMDMNSTNEDEISKKIRLLKKSLEKIFGENASDIGEEFIKLTPTSPCLKIDDSLFKTLKNDWENLAMASFNAPMVNFEESKESFEDSQGQVSFLSRAAYRHQEILSSLS
ncbi:MAG: hypothetical protein K9K67_00405 [Bacteriovoracaceae bacterium]|nr:hypothetical protein [Bacteriovoracaceae bacterium]